MAKKQNCVVHRMVAGRFPVPTLSFDIVPM